MIYYFFFFVKKISKTFVSLIDSIKQLTLTLNNLLHMGYPHLVNIKLNIEESVAKGEDGRGLKEIMNDYKKRNIMFKNSLKDAYERYALLRLFYGPQFIQLYNKAINKNKNEEENKSEKL